MNEWMDVTANVQYEQSVDGDKKCTRLSIWMKYLLSETLSEWSPCHIRITF